MCFFLGVLVIACSLVGAQADATEIGAEVADFTLQDYRGREVRLSDYSEQQAVVLVFLGTECPLAKLYGHRLSQLDQQYADEQVAILGINSNSQDSITEIAAYARRHGIEFPVLKDVGNRVADATGAERTPEAFVLDQQRRIQYRGRIDDQYGIGYVREAANRQDLKAAVDAVLAGKPVEQPRTEAVGCLIGRAREPDPAAEVTYSDQIARILQRRCVECHREGEIAPFALVDYDEVSGWAEQIEEVVVEGRMPPWHADAQPGEFENDRSLSGEEVAQIRAWVAAGAPEGDPAQLPPPRQWTEGWQLPREPDFIAPITEEPFVVPADGSIEYKYFTIDPGFTEDQWVSAVEIQPGNRQVVHHVLMFAGEGRDAVQRFRGGALGYDAGYVPGQRAEPYPEGMARRIPAGSKLIFQVHYTPIGTPATDQTRVGMLMVDPSEVRQEIRTFAAVAPHLNIPPHEADYSISATSRPLKHDAKLLMLAPHMHYRGTAFHYEAHFPDGTRRELLDVPRYDFNWQTAYRLSEHLELPAGTTIHCTAVYDNSSENLSNPDPEQRVRWGEQTWDEMMIGYFDYAVPKGTPEPGQTIRRGDRVARLFARLDADGDGRIVLDEVPRRQQELFKKLDRNEDAELDMKELSRILLLAP